MESKTVTIVDYLSPVYHAVPGIREGDWMVIVQRHSRDPGYGVVTGLRTRKDAETKAGQMNEDGSKLKAE